jgi:hypothetical protein
MRIPFGEVQTGTPSVGAPPLLDVGRMGSSAAIAGAGISEGVAKGSDQASILADKIQEARDSVKVSNAVTDASSQLADARIELENDPDTAGRLAKFQAKAADISAKHLADMYSPRATEQYQLRFNQLFKPMELQVKQQARDEDIQKFKLDLGDSLDKMATQSVFAKSPAEREAMQAEANKQIIDAVATGRMHAVEAIKLKKAFLGRVDGALAAEQVRLDPAGAVQQLGDPATYPNLDAAQRVELRARAQQRVESLANQSSAELHADLTAYSQARAAGQPVPDDVYNQVLSRAGGAGSKIGRLLSASKTFYDAVDQNTQTQSLPVLRDNIARLEGRVTDAVTTIKADAEKKLGALNIPVNVISGARSSEANTAAGGAKNSEHLGGNAIDVSLKGLNDQQRQKLIDTFLSDPKVGGFGYYNGDSIHIDAQQGAKTAWGSDQTAATVGKGWPDWLTQRVNAWQASGASQGGDPTGGPGNKLFDLSVARVVRRQLGEAQRTQQQDFNALDQEFETVRKSGEPFKRMDDLFRMAETLDPSGGLAAVVRERNQLWDRLATAQGEKPSEIQQRLAGINNTRDEQGALTPERVMERHALIAALNSKTEEFTKDPAGAALKYYPTIGETLTAADKLGSSSDAADQAKAASARQGAWAALADAQAREGVPAHLIALLPKKSADALHAQFLTAEGQQRLDLVDSMRNQFGSFWPDVQRQLWHGKPAPADIQVLGALPGDATLPKVEIAEAFKVPDEEAHKQLGKRYTAIDDAVRTAVAGLASTMAQAPDGPQFVGTYQTAIEKLARLYAIRGEGDDNRAAQRAADRVFYDHWDVVDSGGVGVRVPKQGGQPIVEASDVRAAQREVIGALPSLQLTVPAHGKDITDAAAKDMLVSAARSSGYWMTTSDERGMVLSAGPGLPVRLANGNPLVVPFDRVRAMASEKTARHDLELRQAADVAAQASGYPPVPDSEPGNVRLLPPWIARMYEPLPAAGAVDPRMGVVP